MSSIEDYLKEISPPFMEFYIKNKETFETDRMKGCHSGIQRLSGGKKLHTLQVIEKALELNQNQDRREIIECCLVHDIKGCEGLPLTHAQRLAIAATKGLEYKDWRPTNHFRFVVLILIADMWSAFVNVNNLER